MDLSESMKRIAEEIDGQHSAYDINKSVVIVPLKDSRFQSVIVTIEKSGNRSEHQAKLDKRHPYPTNVTPPTAMKNQKKDHIVHPTAECPPARPG